MRLGADAVAVVVVVVAAAWVTAAQVPLVDTEDGRVSGIMEKSMKGRDFYSFYGIPFAQPPLGKLRFKDPKPFSAWEGIHEASIPAAPCLQPSFGAKMKLEVLGEEDCLYLNVFKPKLKDETVLPVMVWIHGGGFSFGSAQEYSPHVLLDHDIVMVMVQYRLGFLGFLSTEDSVMPGNLALKDQTMALKWVQRNIHAFGGDKTRVTIFGESAGGAAVHFQMLTPKAEGLFSRAILQSGTALCPWAINNAPRKVTLHVADAVGCLTDQGSESLLMCLQAVDATVFPPLLQDFRVWGSLPIVLSPWVDGTYIPDHPAQLVREGRHAKVDLIAGITKDEGTLFVLPALEKKFLLQELQYNYSVAGPASLQLVDKSKDPVALAYQVYHHYLGTTHVTEAHTEDLIRMLGNHHFAMCHDLTTSHYARHLHPAKKTFRYELEHQGQLSFKQILCPSCDQEWVCHFDDTYYLFGPTPLLVKPTNLQHQAKDLQRPNDLALRHFITTLWTNFAATGNPTPNASLGFTWEPSTADNLQYLSLTPLPSMKPDSRKEARTFHNSLPIEENLVLHSHLVEGTPYEPRDAKHSLKNEL